MALTPAELENLHNMVAAHWLRAQETICAYQRESTKSNRISESLKIGTIVAALLTAGSQAIPQTVSLGIPVAVITAGLATIEKMYSPQEKLQQFWNGQKRLEVLMAELLTVLYSLRGMQDEPAGVQVINQVNNKIIEASNLRVVITDADRKVADQLMGTSPVGTFMAVRRLGRMLRLSAAKAQPE